MSWKCVPGQTTVLWTSGPSLTCSVRHCYGEGRGARHSGLSSALSSSPLACLGLPGDHLEALCSLSAQEDRDMPSGPGGLSGVLYLVVWVLVSQY